MGIVNSASDIANPEAVRGRLLDKIIPVTESGCWLWTGGVNEDGYGQIGIGGSGNTTKTHRVAYVLFNGPIPKGKLVRHKCDVPSCCNPAHLAVGTDKDNSDDKVARNRVPLGERNGKSKLTEPQVMRIISSPLSERALSREMGIPRPTINSVRSGRAWNHLTKIKTAA